MSNQDNDDQANDATLYENLPAKQVYILLLSISVVAMCGIVYELIIATISSYLLGNSVYQFSITIGFFMFAMGIGSYLSQFLLGHLVRNFVYVEIVLALVGGICSLVLFFTFPFSPGLYQTVMLAFILAIGTLVGLEIPLLTRILAQSSGTRKSIANVMSLDYIGALIGSVAFPLMLLPGLGLMRSSFAIGIINILVAFITVIYLKEFIPHSKRVLQVIGATFMLLVGFTILGDRLTSYAQQNLYFDKIVWKKQTKYQSLIVTRHHQRNDLRLFIDGHIQFSQRDEYRYHEALVHPIMSMTGNAETILVMGGGDGLAVRELLKHKSIKRIDLVDLDPAMTKIGKTFAPLVRLNKNAMNDPRVHVYNEDAFVFIRRKGLSYDRIILDFPDPHNEAISKLYSEEFYTMLSKRLSDSGVMITQSSSPFFARQTFWSIAATLEKVFPVTRNFHVTVPAFGLWGFNIAYKNKALKHGSISVPTRFLTDQGFAASHYFGRDISKPPNIKANSIFKPTLYNYYLQDLKI